jgi:hypothetical protein
VQASFEVSICPLALLVALIMTKIEYRNLLPAVLLRSGALRTKFWIGSSWSLPRFRQCCWLSQPYTDFESEVWLGRASLLFTPFGLLSAFFITATSGLRSDFQQVRSELFSTGCLTAASSLYGLLSSFDGPRWLTVDRREAWRLCERIVGEFF